MELTDAQIHCFDTQGYLFFPSLLNTTEVSIIQRVVPPILRRSGSEIIHEKEHPKATRLAFGAHTYAVPFGILPRLPRLLNPVRQLLRDEVYLHQSRLNPKAGFGQGNAWDWHQDYPPWHHIDGMPEPHCVMTSVFIDDCTAITSPLLLVPGSQRHGLLKASLHKNARGEGYDLHHIDQSTFAQLADEHGIEALIGPAGSVAFIHCNVLHGSANNISPWQRAIMYLIYNAVHNACTDSTRPWYQNNRDFTPLTPLADNALHNLSTTQSLLT